MLNFTAESFLTQSEPLYRHATDVNDVVPSSPKEEMNTPGRLHELQTLRPEWKERPLG